MNSDAHQSGSMNGNDGLPPTPAPAASTGGAVGKVSGSASGGKVLPKEEVSAEEERDEVEVNVAVVAAAVGVGCAGNSVRMAAWAGRGANK